MQIEIRGIPGDTALQAHVLRQLTQAIDPLRVKPVAAEVGFADENGPKGGVATRCALTLHVPRRRALHVDHLGETPRLAFDGGFARLERRLERDRTRERERRRRPKKYYAARRLLAAEGGGPETLEAEAG
jgi:ribosome-associated translation inhibitor RaiA